MKQPLATLLALFLLGAGPLQADTEKLQQAIGGDHRTPSWTERDRYRHPLKTLQLFDIQPQHTVVEIWPGSGWYTEILAPYLRDQGQLIAAHYDSNDTQASYRAKARRKFEEKMAASPDVYGKVKISSLMVEEGAKQGEGSVRIAAAAPATADRVVTFRNAHGWHAQGTSGAIFKHFFDILKPGGKLGIVQHMADPEQDWVSQNIGYVGREFIISQAVAAGFTLHAEGFFNRNALDNKRYPGGVWQLPPTLSELETEAEKAPYLAIGESERMTLVFSKPL
jgi:predicted methyltransferase